MTPEERADRLITEMMADLKTTNGDCRWHEFIVAAIRAAENEAIERAAAVCEEVGSPLHPACRGELNLLAAIIRALKEGER